MTEKKQFERGRGRRRKGGREVGEEQDREMDGEVGEVNVGGGTAWKKMEEE